MGGCTTKFDRADSAPRPADPLAIYQTQIVVGECEFSEKPLAKVAPVVGALLAGVVTQSVTSFGNALTEAGKEKTWLSPAFRNIVAKQKLTQGCFQIARGYFHVGFHSEGERAAKLEAAKRNVTISGTEITADRIEMLWARRMWLASEPDFMFEGLFLPTDDQRFVTVAPGYVWFGVPAGQRLFRVDQSRTVAVHMAFPEIGKTDPVTSQSTGGFMALGRMTPKTEKLYPYPEFSIDSTVNRGPTESKWFSILFDKEKSTPMTIAALVTEHEDEDAFLSFLGASVGGAKGELSKELQKLLVPSQIAAGEEANIKLKDAFDKAVDDLRSATVTCSSSDLKEPATTAANIRDKIRDMKTKARASGDEKKIEQININSITITSDKSVVNSDCKKLLEKLKTI